MRPREKTKLVEKVIEYISERKKKLDYNELCELISQQCAKYDLNEDLIRTIGGWNINEVEECVQLWFECFQLKNDGENADEIQDMYNDRFNGLSEKEQKTVCRKIDELNLVN